MVQRTGNECKLTGEKQDVYLWSRDFFSPRHDAFDNFPGTFHNRIWTIKNFHNYAN